jgi:hypothetical protein
MRKMLWLCIPLLGITGCAVLQRMGIHTGDVNEPATFVDPNALTGTGILISTTGLILGIPILLGTGIFITKLAELLRKKE